MRVLLFPVMIGLCGLLATLFGGPGSPLSGRVAAEIDGHTVIVTDCYRLRDCPVLKLEETEAGEEVYRFAPCRDTEVIIEGDRLLVNGVLYGILNPGSTVLVHENEVVVNREERSPLPPPQ